MSDTVLDTTLTLELIEEGRAREFVHEINKLRKTQGFSLSDKIIISVDGREAELCKAIREYQDYILKETLATNIEYGNGPTEVR